jgi:hypothetical protein
MAWQCARTSNELQRYLADSNTNFSGSIQLARRVVRQIFR